MSARRPLAALAGSALVLVVAPLIAPAVALAETGTPAPACAARGASDPSALPGVGRDDAAEVVRRARHWFGA